MPTQKVKLSSEQQGAIEVMKNSEMDIVYLTGKAGTGKSTVIDHYIEDRKKAKKRVVVLASTGIAALNVEGVTVHSFFHFGGDGFDKMYSAPLDSDMWDSFDEMIIDEVSMVRADLMNAVINSLQDSDKENKGLTGGKRLILVGDMAQLPPVVKYGCERTDLVMNQYPGIYFYHALMGMGKVIEVVRLNEIHRQEKGAFQDILNKLRSGDVNDALLNTLNRRVEANNDHDVVTITTIRKRADEVNEKRLKDLKGKESLFWGKVDEKFDNVFPSPLELKLKEGARVMFTVNKSDGGTRIFANGEMGTIAKKGLNKRDAEGRQYIRVIKDDGETVDVYRNKWEYYEYVSKGGKLEKELLGTYKQFPLKLGWALTIHKSQGLSFPKVHVDTVNGCFTHGQLYVALSRCKSLEGLSLEKKITKRDVRFDKELEIII